jgi:RNA polymerase sigma-70 factor (ECF subfamily)
MLMAAKVDNWFGAPSKPCSCGSEGCTDIEGAAPQMVTTEREPRTATELENENRIALGQLFEQHHRRLVRAAMRITRNQDEAEDVVQEALMRALVKLHTFRGESRLETWVYTIVGNCGISRLRSPARRHLVLLDSESSADQNSPRWVSLKSTTDPEGDYMAFELHEIVRCELEALKAPYRSVIQLCDLEGWTCGDAAEILQINQHTLKARLYRGRRCLRERVLTRVLGSEHPLLQVTQLRVHTATRPRRRKAAQLNAASEERGLL